MASCHNVMKTNLPSLSCRCALKWELKKWLLAELLVSIVTMFPGKKYCHAERVAK